MITKDTRLQYLRAFGSPILQQEPDGEVAFVEDDEGNAYSLAGLTDADIMDKISRSMIAGINLFFVECPPYDLHYDQDSVY